jgi:serine/threonine-protein kinase
MDFPKNYQILHHLGTGGIGQVFKARDVYLDRLVALKTINSSLGGDKGALRALLQREAQIAAQFEHPNIIRIYAFDFINDSCYYVMEFAEGGNVRRLMGNGPMPPKEALAIMRQLCSALDFVHSQQWIHLDLKPTNLLLSRFGELKISDFGMAQKITKKHISFFSFPGGTPAYMAPELLEGGKIDFRTDIYSLGVILHELLEGAKPNSFEHETEKKGKKRLPELTVEEDLAELVLRCLKHSPKERPLVQEIMATLEEIEKKRGRVVHGGAKSVNRPLLRERRLQNSPPTSEAETAPFFFEAKDK